MLKREWHAGIGSGRLRFPAVLDKTASDPGAEIGIRRGPESAFASESNRRRECVGLPRPPAPKSRRVYLDRVPIQYVRDPTVPGATQAINHQPTGIRRCDRE